MVLEGSAIKSDLRPMQHVYGISQGSHQNYCLDVCGHFSLEIIACEKKILKQKI